MGFLDKAKAAASDLAAKADTALTNSGLGAAKPPGAADADRYFRDLGVLTYLDARGRAGSPEERARVLAALEELEAHGALHSFALHTSPPPAPGMAAAAGQAAYPPPPPPGPTAAAPPPPGPAAPPPPPPSWMTKDGNA